MGTFWGDNSGIIVMIVLLKTIEKPSDKTKSKPAGTSKSKQQPNRHILPYRPIPDVLFAARRCKSAAPLRGVLDLAKSLHKLYLKIPSHADTRMQTFEEYRGKPWRVFKPSLPPTDPAYPAGGHGISLIFVFFALFSHAKNA